MVNTLRSSIIDSRKACLSNSNLSVRQKGTKTALIDKLKKKDKDWHDKTTLYEALDDHVVKMDTPWFDSIGDSVAFYVEDMGSHKLRLTDDGWTIHRLKSYGVTVEDKESTVYRELHQMIRDLGLAIVDDEIVAITSLDYFPIVKQAMEQAIIQANMLLRMRGTFVGDDE